MLPEPASGVEVEGGQLKLSLLSDAVLPMFAASRGEPLEVIKPSVEVGASAPDPRQADPLRRLDPDRRFVTLVARQMIDDPLRWCGVRPIVDQLR